MPAAVLDVDGTLVDTNYHHAIAWYRAFLTVGRTVPVWRLHRSIGMGGDRLVPEVAGTDFDRAFGDEVRSRWTTEFDRLIDEVRPFPGVDRLFDVLTDSGHSIVLATSGQPQHVDHFLHLLDATHLPRTTSDDVEATKPAPDLIKAALTEVSEPTGVTLGDSTWDCQASRSAGLPAVGLLTGGFGEAELKEAGAQAIYSSVEDLVDHITTSPFRTT
ncbi:HAD family hydrolase [Actinokineospora bangkokensis]|uniref:HAD family hydrolase n=1 Tax=Actinokineospora bangkokensis TaxID=1193682 RepID=A0A1Q9LJC4_9PSEU|nr:HAD family hydrolase [Actinokineospora bangkokensis]OLR92152.1 HAD family hydrolase [Actinokineospora bangkokensis]